MTTTAVPDTLRLDPDVMAAAVIASGGSADGASDRAKALAAEALAVADRDVMDDIVEAIQADYVPSGNTGPRVSDVGACRRAVWYREAPPDGFVPDPPQYQRQAALGTLIHAKAAEVRAARYPWRRYEFEVPVPGLDKMARVDEYDPILGEVTDDKCLTLDTPVLMADGSEKPASHVRVGDLVVSWDPHRDRLVPAPVVWVGDNGVHAIYRIETRGGRSVRVTGNHPILVQRGWTRHWVKAEDVRKGDRAFVALGWQPEDNQSTLSAQDAYLLGALAGDGETGAIASGSTDATVRFHNLDEAVVAAVDSALAEHGMRLSEPRSANRCTRAVVRLDGAKGRRQEFHRWLRSHDLAHGAHGKHVPEAVMSGGADVWVNFLAGMLDTDGSVGSRKAGASHQVSWSSVSRRLLAQMQTLLAGLGIMANLTGERLTRYKDRSFRYYTLSVQSRYGVLRLADLLPVRGAKADLLRLAGAAVRGIVGDTGPEATYRLASVTAVTVEDPEPTIGIEVEGTHTHVTGGLITHNTAGSRKWEVVGEEGPAESAWAQGLLYAYALDELGLPVQTVRIIVINRDTGAEEHFRRDYDPAAARQVLDDLVELATMLDLGVVPPRDGTGPHTDWQCRACFAMSHCWNVEAAADAGRLPESYTLLGADPDDETIVWAAERLMLARLAAKAAKAEEDAAKDLMEGIEPGEYGDFIVSLTRRQMPNYKDSFERLLELYTLSEAYRPPVSEVSQPLMRIDKYTTVRRKRAAQRGKTAKTGGAA